MIDIEPGHRGDGQQPGSAPGLASRTTGYRQVSEIEEITEEARPGVQAAIDAGKLQYRPAAMHGNPWLRLLRREVEDLVSTRHGERYLLERQARTELKRVNRELKQLRAQLTALEERRAALLS